MVNDDYATKHCGLYTEEPLNVSVTATTDEFSVVFEFQPQDSCQTEIWLVIIIITLSVSRQVHCRFQIRFSRGCDILLLFFPISICLVTDIAGGKEAEGV